MSYCTFILKRGNYLLELEHCVEEETEMSLEGKITAYLQFKLIWFVFFIRTYCSLSPTGCHCSVTKQYNNA